MDSWTNGPGSDPHWYTRWKITPVFEPLKQTVVGSIQNVLWVVMATIGVVMLIACTNVANLLLVRADGRQQELAVRAALGAGRWRIARELLLESLTLGLLGGAAGVTVAFGGLRLLRAIGPAELPRLNEISLDGWSIGFTLILAVLSGLFLGAIPTLRYAPARHRLTVLGATRSASTSRERQRGRNLLVVAQVSMALVLLIGAVLMIRTFMAMRNVDPGFSDPASMLVMHISIPSTLVRDPQMVTRMQNNILDKLAAIPGVSSTGFAASVPMSGAEPAWNQIYAEGKNDVADNAPMRLYNFVSPGYFNTAGTRIVAGRDFTWEEVYDMRPVGMVSESLARELWGSPQAAIGKHFREWESMPWHEVVGVVADVRENGVDQVGRPRLSIGRRWCTISTAQGLSMRRRTVYFSLRTHACPGNQSLVERHAAGSLGCEFESACCQCEHDAGYLRRIDGAHLVHAGDHRWPLAAAAAARHRARAHARTLRDRWRWHWAFWEFTA